MKERVNRPATGRPRPFGGPLDRRQFLHRAGLLGLGSVGTGLLAACGAKAPASAGAGGGGGGGGGTVVWANWPLSVDTDSNGNIPSLQQFTKSTGLKADYQAAINDNNEWFAKIQPLMRSGQGIDASVVSPTDWMAHRLIDLGWIEQLDTSKIPNAKNQIAVFRDPPFDPHNRYSLAWQGWLSGIAVNTDVTGREVHSIDDMLTAPDLKGKVSILSEMIESSGLIMLSQGADPTAFTQAQFENALEAIKKATASGQIRKVTGNDYAPELAKGNIGVCFGWGGDVIQLSKDNPKIKFIIPDSGAILDWDTMMIPKYAPNPDGASKLIDYYYEPKVAAQVAAYVNAVTPVAGAEEEMSKVDASLVGNKFIFPTEADMKQMHQYKPLDSATMQKYQNMFNRAIGV